MPIHLAHLHKQLIKSAKIIKLKYTAWCFPPIRFCEVFLMESFLPAVSHQIQ